MGPRKRKRSSSSEHTVGDVNSSNPPKRSSRTLQSLQRDNVPTEVKSNDSEINKSTEETSSSSSSPSNKDVLINSVECVQDFQSLHLSPTSTEPSTSSSSSNILQNYEKFREAYRHYYGRDDYEMAKTLLYHYSISGIENFEQAEELENFVAEEEARRSITKPDYAAMYIDHSDYITAKKLLMGFERYGCANWHDAQKLRDFIELAERLHPSFAQTSNGIASSGDGETSSIETLQPVEPSHPNQDALVNLLQMFPQISDSDESVQGPQNLHSSPTSSVSSNQNLKPLEPLTSPQTPIRPPEAPQPQRFKSNTMANASSTKRRRNLKNDLGNHSLETYGSFPASSTENAPDKAEELFQDSSDSVKADGNEEVSDENPSTSTLGTTVSMSETPMAKRRRKLDFKQAQQPLTSDTIISTSSRKFISESGVDIDKESQLYESALQLFANFRSIGQEKIATAFEQVLLNHTSGSNNVAENAAGNSSEGSILSNFYLQLGQLVERFKENGRHVLAAELDNAYKKDERRNIDMNSNLLYSGVPKSGIQINARSDNLTVKNNQRQSINDKGLYDNDAVNSQTRPISYNVITNSEGKPIYVKLYAPEYEFVRAYNSRKRKIVKKLVVFTNDERTTCYCYSFVACFKCYECDGCRRLPRKTGIGGRISIRANFIPGGNEKEYVELIRTNHHCRPISYQSITESVNLIVENSDYEIVELGQDGRKYLNIFVQNDIDNGICNGYRLHYQKKWNHFACSDPDCHVHAHHVQLENGDFGMIENSTHTCQIRPLRKHIKRKYVRSVNPRLFNANLNEQQPVYVKCYPPSYELVSDFNTRRKTFVNNLIIFTNDERTLCYRYRPDPKTQIFVCEGCIKLPRLNGQSHLSAKIAYDNAGKEYVELSRTNHHCQPISYQSITGSANRILRKPDFEVINANGKNHVNVFLELDDEQCICNGYRFGYDKTKDHYICAAKNCYVRGYVATLKNEQVFKLSGEHTCTIRHLQDFIIKSPMFLKKTKGSILVFYNEDPRKSYEYKKPYQGLSYCLDCLKLGQSVNVKFCKDGDNEYLKVSRKPHICKPIIRKPEFENFAIKNLKRPKRGAGKKGLAVLDKCLSKDDKNAASAQTYIATLKGPDAPLVERYSASFYIGKSNNLKKRLKLHWTDQSIVGQMVKKHGKVYLVPIYTSSPARCFDMEGIGIELRRQGSIDFPFFNIRSPDWNSKTLKDICKDPDHPEHGKIVDGFNRLVYDAMKKVDDFVSEWN